MANSKIQILSTAFAVALTLSACGSADEAPAADSTGDGETTIDNTEVPADDEPAEDDDPVDEPAEDDDPVDEPAEDASADIDDGDASSDEKNEPESSTVRPADYTWRGVPGERMTPSEACEAAAVAAAEEEDMFVQDDLITVTLEECSSVSEWMSVVEMHPDAMDGSKPDIDTLIVACWDYEETVVCADALEQDLIDPYYGAE